MTINWKKLILYIIIPLFLGGIVGFLSGSFDGANNIVMPNYAPPMVLFPIVWSILYVLMGISRYIIEGKENTSKVIKIYNFQLFINLMWCFIFFSCKWFLLSFLWILFLIVVVIRMIRELYSINKASAYIQIPYLLWIIFAAFLNFSIYLLN